MLTRAYSVLHVKSLDDSQRIIEGLASEASTDRDGDTLVPEGAVFKLPMPLLWLHQQGRPIGHVVSARVTKSGIFIRAQFERAGLLPHIDEAWTMVKAGLARGLSVGFNAVDFERVPGRKGIRFNKWEWNELSVVTIPANALTTISVIKSLDVASLAASGHTPSFTQPGASGLSRGDAHRGVMTASERLTQKKAALNTASARYEELLGADELTDDQRTEKGTLTQTVKSLTVECDELEVLEAAQRRQASSIVIPDRKLQPIGKAADVQVIDPRASLPKGWAFARYAMAVAAGKGSISDTVAYAKRWENQTPEVLKFIKDQYTKAIEGTSVVGSPAWGGELVFQNNLASEFIELLRAATVMGKISGWRMVPFNVRVPRQTAGSTVDWVGESGVKQVGELAFDTVTLDYDKIAGIVVLTEELVRLSAPNAEETVRRDLTEQIARFIDRQLFDTSVTATANRPASLTNGLSATAATGSDANAFYVDMNTALANFDAAEIGTDGITIVTTPAIARGLSTLRSSLSTREFPEMTPSGGTLLGFPVVVSNSIPSGMIAFVKASEIFVADDGRVTLDASNQATLDMSGGSTPTFSLWQKNCIGLRAERWITYKKRRDEAVAIISGAAYGPTVVT